MCHENLLVLRVCSVSVPVSPRHQLRAESLETLVDLLAVHVAVVGSREIWNLVSRLNAEYLVFWIHILPGQTVRSPFALPLGSTVHRKLCELPYSEKATENTVPLPLINELRPNRQGRRRV